MLKYKDLTPNYIHDTFDSAEALLNNPPGNEGGSVMDVYNRLIYIICILKDCFYHPFVKDIEISYKRAEELLDRIDLEIRNHPK